MTGMIFFITMLLTLSLVHSQEAKCCSDCSEKIRDRYAAGYEAFYLRSNIDFYLMRKMPLTGLTNLLANMPSNLTEYLATRALDTKERADNQLLRWSINIGNSTGIDATRQSYASMKPAFVLSIIVALNHTITKNTFKEDAAYIQLKQKYYDEVFSKYKDWYYNRNYYQGKDIQKKANIAAMALLFSELSTIGPDEQIDLRQEIRSIYDSCYDNKPVFRESSPCHRLPESSDWQREEIDKVLYPIPAKRIDEIKSLTYAIRSRNSYFKGDGHLNIGYFYKKGNTVIREGKSSFDWTRTIEPVFELFNTGDPRVDDPDVLMLIRSIRTENLFLKGIGPIGTHDYRMKWGSFQAYNIATMYVPYLVSYYGQDFYNSISQSCPVTCNSEC